MAAGGGQDTKVVQFLTRSFRKTQEDLDAAALVGRMSQAGLPNMRIPRREAFHRIEAIPLLGIGKIDLKAVKEMARRLTGGSQA